LARHFDLNLLDIFRCSRQTHPTDRFTGALTYSSVGLAILGAPAKDFLSNWRLTGGTSERAAQRQTKRGR
jgi:hypothetical protein